MPGVVKNVLRDTETVYQIVLGQVFPRVEADVDIQSQQSEVVRGLFHLAAVPAGNALRA